MFFCLFFFGKSNAAFHATIMLNIGTDISFANIVDPDHTCFQGQFYQAL